MVDSSPWQSALAFMTQQSFDKVSPRSSWIAVYPRRGRPHDSTSVQPILGHPIQNPGRPKWALPDGGNLRIGEALPCGLGPAPASPRDFVLTAVDVTRLERVEAFLYELEGDRQEAESFHQPYKRARYPDEHYDKSLWVTAADFPDDAFFAAFGLQDAFATVFGWPRFTGAGHLTSMIVLSVVYGGLHLTAWDSEFPSAPEALFWKVASIIIMALLSLWAVYVFALLAITKSGSVSRLRSIQFILRSPPALLVVGLFARLYLIIEAFISLRAVPIGVYLTPPWIQMIPHV